MTDVTFEELVKRVEVLEKKINVPDAAPRKKDWRRVVGMFAGSEFYQQVVEEGRKIREADRESTAEDSIQ